MTKIHQLFMVICDINKYNELQATLICVISPCYFLALLIVLYYYLQLDR